jgi:hypothetical protein
VKGIEKINIMSNKRDIEILAADYEIQLSLLIVRFKLRPQFIQSLRDMKKCSQAEAHKEWKRDYESQEVVCAASRDELKRALNV